MNNKTSHIVSAQEAKTISNQVSFQIENKKELTQ